MLETLLPYVWLCLAALVAGAVNAMAGGGTILTFPALMSVLAGVDNFAVLANATSTVSLVPGSASGAWAYRHDLATVRQWLKLLFLPSLIGGTVGSLLVTSEWSQKYFPLLVPWLILGAAVLFALQPLLTRRRTLVKANGGEQQRGHTPDNPAQEFPTWRGQVAIILFQSLVGLYGGYFGAGIGILMLSGLGLIGMRDFHGMNAVKNVLAFCINGVSVAIFVARGVVVWQYAAPMAVSAVIGAFLGVRLAKRLPTRVVRWIVIGIGFGLAGYYFWKQWG